LGGLDMFDVKVLLTNMKEYLKGINQSTNAILEILSKSEDTTLSKKKLKRIEYLVCRIEENLNLLKAELENYFEALEQ